MLFVKQAPPFAHVYDQKIASIALEKGNGASSSNYQLQLVPAPIVESLGKNVILPVHKYCEMDIGMGLTGAEARKV